MQITRVELRNIKNHAQAEWTFFPGLIAICGPNGSGKTTILEAIAWALFDQLDYKREDFVKRGQPKGQVTVSFISDLDDREYTVHRDTSGAYFCTDAVTKARLAEQKNQVLPWLCQHISVEPGTDLALLFRTTIGVPQGTFTHDFALRPAERKRIFDHTLRVDEYRDASDRLRQTVKYVDGEITKANLSIAAAEGELRVYDQTRADLSRSTQGEHALNLDYETASSELSRLTRDVTALNGLQRQLESQRGLLETHELKLRLTRDKLASAMESADQGRTSAKLVADARDGYEKYIAASTRLNELDQQRAARDRLRAEVTVMERSQFKLQARKAQYLSMLEQTDAYQLELAGIDDKIKSQEELESRIASLREGRGTREAERRQVEMLDKELQHLRKRYSEASRELERAAAQQSLALRLPLLEGEHVQLQSLVARHEMTRQNLILRQEQADGLSRELDRLRVEHASRVLGIAELDTLTATAGQLDTANATFHEEAARLARLRAEAERDAAMVSSLESGGICPLLTEKCLNLTPGESLDGRLRANISARLEEVSRLEGLVSQLGVDLLRAQEAAARLGHLPVLTAELIRIDETIVRGTEQLETIQDELRVRSATFEEETELVRMRRGTLEVELSEARAAHEVFQRVPSLRREIDEIRERGNALRDEREERAARVRDAVDYDTDLSQAEESLRALGNPRARRAELERQLAQAAQWRSILESASAELASVDVQLLGLLTGLEDYQRLEEELATAGAKRTAHEGDYRTFIANEQTALTIERRQQEVTQITLEVAAAEQQVTTIRSDLSALEAQYDGRRHVDVQTRLDEISRRTIQLAAQLEHVRKETRQLSERLFRLEGVRVAMVAKRSDRDRLQRLSETTDFIRNTLMQAAPYITEAYVFSISHEANQLYREISGRQDVSLRWTRDYEITLEEEGQSRPFGNLSGGEQMAAALAIRLALLKELSELNIAFFDEPTANLDEDRRHNLAQQIGRIKHFKQLFVVSHDDSFEAYTDQVIMLTEKQPSETSSSTP